MEQSEGIRISIFDQVYQLKTDAAGRAHLQEAARYVDQKMHAVASRTQTVDSYRIAVLAALHIADELSRLKEEHRRLQNGVQTQTSRCTALLDEALGARFESSPAEI